MSVQAVQHGQQAAQAEAASKAQEAQKPASQKNAVPEDKVTISPEAQAKQTALAVGADKDHDGK